jgi:mannose-6-phosphate isomerase-like protein (cupin superfamily)
MVFGCIERQEESTMKPKSMKAGMAAIAMAATSFCLIPQAIQAQPAAAPAGAPAAGGQPPAGGRQGGGQAAVPVYTFKPIDISYHAPMKPVYHIADIIAAHKGQTDWEQPVVKDAWFFNQYISQGPGKKTPVSFQGDTAILFIINSGRVRFNFKDFPAIEAGEDGLVSIPARIPYSIETISSTPSIRFEIRSVVNGTIFPVADNPTPPVAPPGYTTVRVDCRCMFNSVKDMKPEFFDYGGWAKANPDGARAPEPRAPGQFYMDGNVFLYTSRSTTGVPLPPPNVVGHFHTGQAEWWYVLEGNMATRIEGQGDVYGSHGDFIYSPQGAYHQTIMLGKPSTRTPAGKTGVMDSAISLVPAGGSGGGD